MEKLSEKSLKKVKGGASFWAIVGVISAALAFIGGVLDGYARPTKCN